MNAVIDISEREQAFSTYHETMDKYFQDNEVAFICFPKEISKMAEPEFPNVRFTSAKQYVDFLERERAFWGEKDPDRKLQSIAQYDRLDVAKRHFEQAVQNVQNLSSMQNSLRQSRSALSMGVLFSQTKLTKTLLEYIDRSPSFFSGFKAGILDNKNASTPSQMDGWEGVYAALAYKEAYKQYLARARGVMRNLRHNIEEATKNYSELNQAYVSSFHEQERRIAEITTQTNNHLSEMERKSKQQILEADGRLTKMEALYREKLRLEGPAEYWKKMDEKYKTKGNWWLVGSCLMAAAIVGGLIWFLLSAPTIFSDDYHWFDNLKNSAVITVVASIAIYMLRLTVRMATSSYHLSRDACERENLSYFYLALIEKGAVSDKERALILNALFSRSDTGLLKGEAAPSMPTNVSDIVDFLKNAK